MGDFEGEAQTRERHYPESIILLRRLTGVAEVMISDHTLHVDQIERGERGLREPMRYVHNDQTLHLTPRRVRNHLPTERAKRRLAGYFQIINLWRPLGHPAQRAPLALLDTRSLVFDDLAANDLVYRDEVGETYSIKPNPERHWYYYPHLLPEEALLLKIHDSWEDAQARLSAHTAFGDPYTPADAPPRQSIELCCLPSFDK